jgi:hypothetical protein
VSNSKRVLAWVVLAGGLANLGGVVSGQTLERDTTITGPRGRTIQRQVEVQRGAGTIDRSIRVTRPGGTIDREVQLQRAPAMRRGLIPGPWPRPAWVGPRPLIIAQPAPAFGFGLMAAPFLNFSFGGGGGGGGFGVGGGMGGMGGPAGQPVPPPPPPDQVALMCQRLQGFGVNGRKEAAYTLGRLGDPRAVPSLIHVLKYDNFKDVRVAAAIALGEIGGSDAAVALERAAVYDHREDVKKAARTALERLNVKAKAAATLARPPAMTAQPPAARPPAGQPWVPAMSAPSPFREAPASGGVAPVSPRETDPNGRHR